MNRSVGSGPLLGLAALAALLLAIPPSLVDAQAKDVRTHARSHRHRPPPKPQETAVAKPQETINAWSVGLAGGLLEGAPIRFAAEVAQR